ncbi:hypothetical protein FOH10_07335 [Nocardia otitidiscaviarum]|uniref:Uncharacterized protein n=1 Tax=Nocardia otitidiscaviarum TaxID=1823 RepID=A0A516NI63_9NOCA|nr:hypothetical protein [Nocardia otitidiscaviarum]MCP9619939.1 hypothetical protein [Nocardia otitidiscaviarum]QDP78580.1 hypothetical protein FOH10_07335 [Nocardia otitidiscaviarum]
MGLAGFAFVAVALPAVRVRRTGLPRQVGVAELGDGSFGLRFDVRRSLKPLLLAFFLVGALFVLLRAYIFASQAVETDNSIRASIYFVGAIVAAVLLVIFIGLFVYQSRTRSSGSFLVISESGVFQGKGRAVSRLDWSEIGQIEPVLQNSVATVRITPVPGTKVHVEAANSWLGRMEERSLRYAIDIPAWTLKIDPPLLLHLVRFYWRNPGLRTELTCDAVIDRMRRADFRRPKLDSSPATDS